MNGKILEGLNVLVVEEEALIAMDIEQLCYDHGAVAVTTVSSLARLTPETLDSAQVSAAILDAKIGEGWTTDFAYELLERKIPFVLATGYTDAEPFFARMPEISVVPKPYVGADLAQALAAEVARLRSGNG